MPLADELEKLQELHASGALTDAEFSAAKQALLALAPPAVPVPAPLPTQTVRISGLGCQVFLEDSTGSPHL